MTSLHIILACVLLTLLVVVLVLIQVRRNSNSFISGLDEAKSAHTRVDRLDNELREVHSALTRIEASWDWLKRRFNK